MHNPIKTLFFVGIAIVGGCAIIVNNKTKFKALIRSVIEAWEKTRDIEEATVVSTSPIEEVNSGVTA